jgi:hypothetical protein
MAPATYGVGNVDSMYYYAPTGGYANTASTWKDSVGAPVQIQVPYAARAMNQACLTTGGSPPLTGALQTGGKRTRKMRGGFELPFKLPFLNNITRRFGFGQEQVVEGEGTAPPAVPAPPENNGNGMPPAKRRKVNNTFVPPGGAPPLPPNNPPLPPNNGNVQMTGGRRRRHRKHKKMTHKRKH